MTMDTTTGDFSLLMKNTNNMELNEKLMEKMKLSKIGYSLSKNYLMTKRENLNRAIKELKSWHLI
ncbi:MAG: hypothetical protein KGH61_03530 [Candidatus Micrarchaeota archaeon]|nr:hypothetical protein [Candidatus Micrarchaeota archaeon]MDE1847994.1 hypothetical protein [Candidatus Micrarchaeota archaeon]MDE1864698.1 hypothetical protein [Candidatus Micrarchaeota archaeon]